MSTTMLTIRETARRCKAEGLRVSELTLRRWTKTGELRCVHAGTRCYILWADLLTLLGVEAPA